MDWKSRILVALLFLLMAASAVAIYWRTMVLLDYPIVTEEL